MKETNNYDLKEKKEKGLNIVAKGQKQLSKNQQLFNKLTKRIETLEKEIVKEDERLNQLLQVHSKEIIPLQEKIAYERIELALTLEKAAEVIKFSKKQSDNIRETIVSLCKDAFEDIEPTPEQVEFYDRYSDMPYYEEIDAIKNETKEMLSDFMNQMFGMEMDMSYFDESAEGFERFEQKMKEQYEQNQSHQQNQKKTKKQQALEDANKQAEEIKNKSIRSVYLALAKVLHPDTEMDPGLKSEKEEILKRVTVAYNQKDLATLLKLEMEWVYQTSEHLEKLTEDKMKIYISALNQQVAELESEKYSLRFHPRYSQIIDYINISGKYALSQIRTEINELKSMFDSLHKFIRTFNKPIAKKEITAFIKVYSIKDELMDDYF